MTAFYLSLHPSRPRVTLIEPFEIPAAASRNAGGLLAYDWHGAATESLGFLSYKLHQSLAEQYDGRNTYGYREVDTVSVAFNSTAARSKAVPGIDWVGDGIPVQRSNLLGTTKTTAQVHPRLFVQRMIAIAQENGVKVVKGSLTGVKMSLNGNVQSIEVTRTEDESKEEVECTDLVMAWAFASESNGCGRLPSPFGAFATTADSLDV
jgi:glycine/D-amino acid oxidase-like deaminating enzyme